VAIRGTRASQVLLEHSVVVAQVTLLAGFDNAITTVGHCNHAIRGAFDHADLRWVPVGIQGHAVHCTHVALLALIRVDNAIPTIVRLHASEPASVSTEIRAIQLAEVALFWGALYYAIAAEGPPHAFCRTAAIHAVVVRPKAACRDRHRSIAAVAFLSGCEDTVTAATTLAIARVAGHATVELVSTNCGAGSSWHGTPPAGFNHLAVSRAAVTADRVPVVTGLVRGQDSVPAHPVVNTGLSRDWTEPVGFKLT
jgi:hypothetical protein